MWETRDWGVHPHRLLPPPPPATAAYNPTNLKSADSRAKQRIALFSGPPSTSQPRRNQIPIAKTHEEKN